MLKKLCTSLFISLIAVSSFLSAIEYDIQDIGTLQTRSSKAIDLNNKGQILGWYALKPLDPSGKEKCYFFQDSDGSFYSIPSFVGMDVDWKFLTEEGKVFGTSFLYDNETNAILFMWDKKTGAVNLGNLPGRNVVGVNNNGQALISCVSERINEKTVLYPAIWHYGELTKLKGLEGNFGLDSDESYGIGINNKGEVIGQSRVNIIYKNELYMKPMHATLWKKEEKLDLHNNFIKTEHSYAFALNDVGDLLIASNILGGLYLDKNGNCYPVPVSYKKMNNIGYVYSDNIVYDAKGRELVVDISNLDNKVKNDINSIWLSVKPEIKKVNDKGEIITQGVTIYGETHAILLVPVKSNQNN